MKCDNCKCDTYVIHVTKNYRRLCGECYYADREKPKKDIFIGRHDDD